MPMLLLTISAKTELLSMETGIPVRKRYHRQQSGWAVIDRITGKDRHFMSPELIPYVFVVIFLYGIVIGSFLNVCIYRVPLGMSVAKERSHCMHCGHQLRWYDLIPVVSFLALRGRCRYCGARISLQYPVVELCNGILYVVICAVNGCTVESGIYCLLASALLVLSVIDERTYEIPLEINLFIGILGAARMAFDVENWLEYASGLLSVSLFLEMLWLLSKGRAIGGGDVKLMAAAGLLLGWKKIILAFLIGCIAGAVLHLVRMKVSGAEKILALGPYLSAGILVSALWGERMIEGYWNFLYSIS